jgi:hypothetical protein
MKNTALLTRVVVDMFEGFPSSSKTTERQIKVYVGELSEWPAAVVARAIKSVRSDPDRNPSFAPTIDEILRQVQTTGMNQAERIEWAELTAAAKAREIQSIHQSPVIQLGRFSKGEGS